MGLSANPIIRLRQLKYLFATHFLSDIAGFTAKYSARAVSLFGKFVNRNFIKNIRKLSFPGSEEYLSEVEKLASLKRVTSARPIGSGINQSLKVIFSEGEMGLFKPLNSEHIANWLGDTTLASGEKAFVGSSVLATREVFSSMLGKIFGIDTQSGVLAEIGNKGLGALMKWDERLANGEDGLGVLSYADAAMYSGKATATNTLQQFSKTMAFDYLINNADRHGGNMAMSSLGEIIHFDQGASFPNGGIWAEGIAPRKNGMYAINPVFVGMQDLHGKYGGVKVSDYLKESLANIKKNKAQIDKIGADLGIEKKSLEKMWDRHSELTRAKTSKDVWNLYNSEHYMTVNGYSNDKPIDFKELDYATKKVEKLGKQQKLGATSKQKLKEILNKHQNQQITIQTHEGMQFLQVKPLRIKRKVKVK